jgi:hypothetical protein
MYANLSNVARDIFSIITHGVGLDASISHGQDAIGYRVSKATGEMLWEKVVIRQFAQANYGILAGHCTALRTADNVNN